MSRAATLPLLLLLLAPVTLYAQADTTSAGPISLQPGDVVKVEVWREKDLTGEFLVDEDGDVVLPRLGEVHVAGIPIGVLRDSLISAYREQLRNPSITILPLRRVYVLGEVNEPGLYTVDPTISLAGAVAMAGGANNEGDLHHIRIVRSGQTLLNGVKAESALASVHIRSGDQIFVGRRGWFDRNSTFIVSALLSMTSIVISLVR